MELLLTEDRLHWQNTQIAGWAELVQDANRDQVNLILDNQKWKVAIYLGEIARTYHSQDIYAFTRKMRKGELLEELLEGFENNPILNSMLCCVWRLGKEGQRGVRKMSV